jgi:hypothetical protein
MRRNRFAAAIGHRGELLGQVVFREKLDAGLVEVGRKQDRAQLGIDENFLFRHSRNPHVVSQTPIGGFSRTQWSIFILA